MPVFHPRAFGAPSSSFGPAPALIGIFVSIFFLILVISCVTTQRRHQLRQRRANILYQSGNAELTSATERRQLQRGIPDTDLLEWNAQRLQNGDFNRKKDGDQRDDIEAAIGRPPPAYQP